MAVDVKKLKVGDLVSEIEFHLDLEVNPSSIHRVTYIELFDHKQYHRIGLSGYVNNPEEIFNEFDVYLLHPGADIKAYEEREQKKL